MVVTVHENGALKEFTGVLSNLCPGIRTASWSVHTSTMGRPEGLE